MTEEVKDKLQKIYDAVTDKARKVIGVFEYEFGEPMVDNSLYTFDEFIHWLEGQTLGSMGIKKFADINESGKYFIDKNDYLANGKGKNFLDYIPDLGIIDYIRPTLISHLRSTIAHKADTSHPQFYIMVRFPKVTVTNENDKSVEITELYAKVFVGLDGHLKGDKFQLNRTEYSVLQWVNDYAHSHLPGIQNKYPEQFRIPCTGSGPINNTIDSLKGKFDLNLWGLFAFELSKYVTVESIRGVPYRRLENIGKGNNLLTIGDPQWRGNLGSYSGYSTRDLQGFVKHYLKLGKLKIAYRKGSYVLGQDFLDFWIDVSNEFIKWHNERVNSGVFNIRPQTMYSTKLLKKVVISEGRIFNSGTNDRMATVQEYEGKPLFMFKGQMQHLHFTGDTQEYNTTILVDEKLCYYILTKALEIISYKYGREEQQTGGQESGNNTGGKTCYL